MGYLYDDFIDILDICCTIMDTRKYVCSELQQSSFDSGLPGEQAHALLMPVKQTIHKQYFE